MGLKGSLRLRQWCGWDWGSDAGALSPSPRVAVYTRAPFPTTLARCATGARGVALATSGRLGLPTPERVMMVVEAGTEASGVLMWRKVGKVHREAVMTYL